MPMLPTPPPMLLLAGTSEAGKSSAGEYLGALGARRIKIRTILVQLTTGREAYHEGTETREEFVYEEFIAKLIELSIASEAPLVVESFIDAALTVELKRAWPSPCDIIFITAPQALRIRRFSAARGMSTKQAQQIVRRKDDRKRVHEQLPTWRAVADHWIDNSADITSFRARLRGALEAIQTPPGGIPS